MWINHTTFIVLLEITLPSMCGMGISSMQGTHGRWGQWILEVPQSCAGNGQVGLPPAHFLVSTLSHACTQALIWLLLHPDVLLLAMSSSRCFSISSNQINQLLML